MNGDENGRFQKLGNQGIRRRPRRRKEMMGFIDDEPMWTCAAGTQVHDVWKKASKITCPVVHLNAEQIDDYALFAKLQGAENGFRVRRLFRAAERQRVREAVIVPLGIDETELIAMLK